jgi:hypothetical protein
MAADQAIELMKSKGFKCEVVSDGEFVAQRRDESGVMRDNKLTNIDYVSCHRMHRGGWVESSEHIALILDDASCVREIAEHRAYWGP